MYFSYRVFGLTLQLCRLEWGAFTLLSYQHTLVHTLKHIEARTHTQLTVRSSPLQLIFPLQVFGSQKMGPLLAKKEGTKVCSGLLQNHLSLRKEQSTLHMKSTLLRCHTSNSRYAHAFTVYPVFICLVLHCSNIQAVHKCNNRF